MGRKRTRPPTPEPKATQQRLRKVKKAHKGDYAVEHLCDQIIAQLDSIKKFSAKDNFAKAEYVRDKLHRLSLPALAKHIKAKLN